MAQDIASRTLAVQLFACRGSPRQIGRSLAEGYRRTGKHLGLTPEAAPRIEDFDLEDACGALRAFAPNLLEEAEGLAEGLGLPLAEALRRFANGRLAFPRRGCSAVLAGGLYGRNYDFDPARYDAALIAVQAEGCHAHLGFADRFTGRLDGMNEPGLCVGLHYVNESVAQPGLGAIAIVRILLDRCATTGEAVAMLSRLPHGLAFNYSLLDAGGAAAIVEAAPGGVAVLEGAHLACTNHFRSAELAGANRADSEASRRRLPPLEAWAAAGLDAGALFHALNAADSPAFQRGYAAGFGTLHTLVCAPAEGVATVGIGADAEPRRLDLRAWAAGGPLDLAPLEGELPAPPEHRFAGRDLSGAEFRDVSLKGARFRDVSLAGASFDDIDFSGAEIGGNCNFTGMTVAGVPLAELFEAHAKQKAGRR